MASLTPAQWERIEQVKWQTVRAMKSASRHPYRWLPPLTLLLCLTFWAWTWMLDQRDAYASMKNKVATLHDSMKGGQTVQQKHSIEWSKFDDLLVGGDSLPSTVQKLMDQGDVSHVEVLAGTYVHEVDSVGRYVCHRIAMQVRGDAVSVRDWVSKSLIAHPALALQSLQMSREQTAIQVIEAKVEWCLFTKLPVERGRP